MGPSGKHALATAAVLFSLLVWCHAGPAMMSCTSWSGSGLCAVDPITKNLATIGCYNGTIGGMSGTHQWYHGSFHSQIKFPSSSTQGIITAFYLIDTVSTSNKDANHFEIDIEFYGAPNPKAIVMATNVFFAGKQNLAQFSLPFDPSTAFHSYSIIWNQRGITWLIDNTPVRVLNFSPDKPRPQQPLLPMFTVWPVNWGDQKPDYSVGPIRAAVKDFEFDGCPFTTSDAGKDSCPTKGGYQFAWNKPLTQAQLSAMRPTPYGMVSKTLTLNDYGWDGA